MKIVLLKLLLVMSVQIFTPYVCVSLYIIDRHINYCYIYEGDNRAPKKRRVRISSGEERIYLLRCNPKGKAGVSRLVQSFLKPKILLLLPFQMQKEKKKS